MHHQSDVHIPGSSVNGPGNFVVSVQVIAFGPLFSLRSNSGQCPDMGLFDGTIGTSPGGSEVPATAKVAGKLETSFGETYFVSFVLLPNGVLFKLRRF